MPKYSFKCEKCGSREHKYVPSSIEEVKCSVCSSISKREMPNLKGSTEVREIVDPYTNITWEQNQQEMIKERREQYYWEVEVPRLVEKYSLETCLENKWLIYNDKGELQINKPPSKR